MGEVHAIVARYPQRELEIRRLCIHDAQFRSICDDYEQAVIALRYWEGKPHDGTLKIEDYRNFLNELETEILTRLDRTQRNTKSRNP